MSILQLLIIWILTVIASFIMELSQELRMFKDVADCGYKLNMDKLKEFQKRIGQKKNSLMWMLVPIYNIMRVMENTMKYSMARRSILDQLSVIDVLDEMDDWELNEYKKKPTGLNAFIVPIKYQDELSKSTIIKLEDGSKIYYTAKDDKIDNEHINIIKVEGPARRLSIEEQKNVVLDSWAKITDTILYDLENLDDVMKFLNVLTNKDENFTINIDTLSKKNREEQIVDSENSKLDTISTQKQELKKFKETLVSDNKNIEEENSYQKTIKKDK